MTNNVLRLTADLMGIDSTSGREGELDGACAPMLESRGWRVTRIPVTPGTLDRVRRGGVHEPFVTLSTHLDTVPPYIAPRLDSDTLWGHGPWDAKGIAAAMICAADRSPRRGSGPVALLFVVGEEMTHNGAHAANVNPGMSRAARRWRPRKASSGGEPRARCASHAYHAARPRTRIS